MNLNRVQSIVTSTFANDWLSAQTTRRVLHAS